MSTMDRKQVQVTLPRRSEALGGQVAEALAGFRMTISDRPVHDGYKLAAVVCLYSQCGWSLEQIGQLFGHPKGHVTRIREFAVKTIRSLMSLNPLASAYDSEDGDDETPTARDEIDMTRNFASLSFDQKRRALASVLDGGDTWPS